MKTLLFLGDSITDAGRLFSKCPDGLGDGYVAALDSMINDGAVNFRLINKGHDGFTVPRIISRLPQDCYPFKPDIVSILAGINDAAVCMNTGISLEDYGFTDHYENLLLSVRSHTTAKIICAGPFIFPYPREYLNWIPLVREMEQRIRELAAKYRITYTPLQDPLNEAAQEYGWEKITVDGVHLTGLGHRLAAEAWLEAMH